MTLAAFNAAPADEAVAAMLACCASRRFAQAMAAGRPYPSADAALTAVDAAFESLTWSDVAGGDGRATRGSAPARAASRRPSSPA